MMLSMLLAALATVSAKGIFQSIDLISLLFLRMLFGTAMLAPFAFFTRKVHVTKSLLTVSGFRGVFLVGVTALYFSAVGTIDAALAATLFHTYPLLVFLVGTVFYRGSLTLYPLLMCALSFVGVILILGPHAITGQMGALLALGSAVLMSFRINLERQLEHALEPLHVMLFSTLVATLLLTPFVDFGSLVPRAEVLGMILMLTAFATGSQLIALTLMAQGEWRSVTVYAYSEIPFVLILSQILFDTQILPVQAIGMAIVFGAGIAFVRMR